jgi:hypothetical protein
VPGGRCLFFVFSCGLPIQPDGYLPLSGGKILLCRVRSSPYRLWPVEADIPSHLQQGIMMFLLGSRQYFEKIIILTYGSRSQLFEIPPSIHFPA